jgi:hypothetical protein
LGRIKKEKFIMAISKTVQIFKTCLIVFTLLIICSFLSPCVYAECNYYECILDEMPGVKNDIVAGQIMAKCKSKCTDKSREEKTRFGFSGRITASKCALTYVKDTKSEKGRHIIRRACYALYPKE